MNAEMTMQEMTDQDIEGVSGALTVSWDWGGCASGAIGGGIAGALGAAWTGGGALAWGAAGAIGGCVGGGLHLAFQTY